MPTAHKSLVLFKRHTAKCHVRKLNLRPTLIRFHMGCECPIWIVGRTPEGREVPRQATGQTDLKRAESVRDAILREAKGDATHGATLVECVRKHLVSAAQDIKPRTLAQHRRVLESLIAYCQERKVFHAADLTVDLLESFKSEGLPGTAATTKKTSNAKLRVFLKAAFRREWIPQSLADKVTPFHAEYGVKQPYTDEEVTAMLDACVQMQGGRYAYTKHPDTFRLLMELMLETGMRVSDAIKFDPQKVVKGSKLWSYSFRMVKRRKSDKPKIVQVFIGARLKKAIDACTWLSPKLPFHYGDFANEDYLPSQVYFRMQTLGKLAKMEDCRPHRLRDTFAVRKLLAGLGLDEVSRLLGHSSTAVTEQFYGAWCLSRRDRLESRVAETMMDA
jgi:integrase